MTAPTLSLAEAAKACAVSESTIRRRRPELLAAGAVQGPKGWSIPVPALIALGLMDRTTNETPESPAGRSPAGDVAALTVAPAESSLTALVEALKADLAAAEQRAAVAEAVAAERERIIAAQAQALRMLEAPKQAPQEVNRLSQESPERRSEGKNEHIAHRKRPWLSRLLDEVRNS